MWSRPAPYEAWIRCSPAYSCRPTKGHQPRVLAFRRGADGALEQAGGYPTGGAGLGAAHLGSQGSVILTTDGRHLLVTNAGSDDISVSL